MRIRVNDLVRVRSGDEGGNTGKVLSVDRQARTVVVEGLNRVYKHVKRSQKNPQGGRLSKELAIPASRVMLVCTACNKPTRVGARIVEGGAKERFCKKCGSGLGELSPRKSVDAASRKA